MKTALIKWIEFVVGVAQEAGTLKAANGLTIPLEAPKKVGHGDFATTLPLLLAKTEGRPPRDIATQLAKQLNDPALRNAFEVANRLDGGSPLPSIEKIEVAGPGYINFFMTKASWHQELINILQEDKNYGRASEGTGKRIQIEFVSANPTGPLHVAHGRAAALGDALARLLESVGYQVDREYYINDVGGQMRLLGESTYLRYRALFGQEIDLPEEGYKGEYIIDIARAVREEESDRYMYGPAETHLPFFTRYSYEKILAWIRRDLHTFRVHFNSWTPEAEIHRDKKIDAVFELLRSKKVLFEEEGALWVKTSRYGDDKDRVVRRSNGVMTYFASDIAYHREKFERGYDRLINIWGADHHGYIGRIKAVVEAMGYAPDRLQILIHQLVNLLRDGRKIKMSKRSGEFVTLRDVMDEVGVDATRFFFLMRRSDTSLDFDLELAKKATNENPVFYVQYAHARLCSIERVAKDRGWDVEDAVRGITVEDLSPLTLPEEQALIRQAARYPDLVLSAAEALEPHRITFYLQELAGLLHRFYFGQRVITEDAALTKARLVLMRTIKIVLQNGLDLLGITAPEQM
ncbi:MAG: arginine--tRNA ligase [Nitrospira sp.]|nr:arginine--tRNA ligase [Candidatus Manganitrophaceae bacterium]HIL34186.1 arginine--tRNA ligase [Candidatus Manganitrophaceae bacterium]